jgi:hypothetical protein
LEFDVNDIENLLRMASSTLLVDITQVRQVIAVAKEILAGAQSSQAERILLEIRLAEAVLEATEVYCNHLIAISREHRQMFYGALR